MPHVGRRPHTLSSSSSFSSSSSIPSSFSPPDANDDDDDDRGGSTAKTTTDYDAFVDDVTAFLAGDGISHRALSGNELRRILRRGSRRRRRRRGVSSISGYDNDDDDRHLEAMMTILQNDAFLLIVGRDGEATGSVSSVSSSSSSEFASSSSSRAGDDGRAMHGRERRSRHSYVLHLCPVPDLDAMVRIHRVVGGGERYRRDVDDGCIDGNDEATTKKTTTTSRAVASHAWLNARLTDAFSSWDDIDDGCDDVPTSIVHLHRDVWERSRSIVSSRLRCKCGMCDARYMARKTIVRKMTRAEYAPFLTRNHLWGATGAKHAYGLYPPVGDRRHTGSNDPVAVVTFSSGRRIIRAGIEYRSFELLRFCTAMDVTVVGGLSRLISAFLRDVSSGERGGVDGSGRSWDNIDIVTSIDRDFGRGNAWPNFVSVEVMDPVPMFVGDVDGIRRHAIGAGLTPLGQPLARLETRTASDAIDVDDYRDRSNETSSTTNASTVVLRAGLPESLLHELGGGRVLEHPDGGENAMGDDRDDRWDDPWRIASERGFHPVFDAGVERLIMMVPGGEGGAEKDAGTGVGLTPSELWNASTPRYAKDHYSSNEGVREMLECIRSGKEFL